MSKPTISFKMGAFKAAAKAMGGKESQIRFALARALNDSAEEARTELIDNVWPSHMKVRNKGFLKATLTTRNDRATKQNLRVAITEADRMAGRGNLKLHADGGTYRALKGRDVAVPSKPIADKKGARGVPKGYRPRGLKDSFRQGDVIYQRTGKYVKATAAKRKRAAKVGKRAKGADRRHKRLMYVLKPRVHIKADVPFRQSFRRTMQKTIQKNFERRFREAMKTAR